MDERLISRRALLAAAAGAAGASAPQAPQSIMTRLGLVNAHQGDAGPSPEGVFNVKAYGAKGDAKTDDSAAIAAAIAAVPRQGGIIYFPPGVYLLKASIVVQARTDLSFLGAGVSATRLQMNGDGVTVLSFAGVCSRITIRDLWLGAVAPFASGGCISIIGTSTTHSDSFVIENVRLQNTPAPWFSQYLDDSQIRNVRIMQTIPGAFKTVAMLMNTCIANTFTEIVMFSTAGPFVSEGVRVDHDCDTIMFVNSQVTHAGTFGWRCAQTGGQTGPRLGRFTNCYAEKSGDSGWLIEAGRDVRLNACHAAVNGGHGFQVTGGDSITVNDSLSLQNRRHGIVVTGGTGVLLNGNTCSNNSQEASAAYHGILIGKNVSGARIVNNRSGDFIFALTNKQGYGIAIDPSGTDWLLITGNDLRDNMRGPLDHPTLGAHTIAAPNLGVVP